MKQARIWIGLFISALALMFAFRRINLGEVWLALQRANYWWLVASIVPLLAFVVLRAYRWRMLFHPQTGLRISNLLAVINIGYLLSNIFPARLGDVGRAYLIGDTEEVSRTVAFSTIVAERVLDALCAVAGFFVVLPFASVPQWMVKSGIIIGVVGLAALIVFVFLVRRREWTLGLMDRILGAMHWPDDERMARFWATVAGRTHLRFIARLPWADRERLGGLAGSLIEGLSGITTLRQGPPLIALSAIIWIDISAFYWLALLAFEPAQPFVAGVAEASVTALGMTVPSTPGAIGVFEVLSKETMVLFGLTPEMALSYGLVAHAVVYLVFTLLGITGMAQQNLSYAEIRKRISTEAKTVP